MYEYKVFIRCFADFPLRSTITQVVAYLYYFVLYHRSLSDFELECLFQIGDFLCLIKRATSTYISLRVAILVISAAT